jgi:hypothetical protein
VFYAIRLRDIENKDDEGMNAALWGLFYTLKD